MSNFTPEEYEFEESELDASTFRHPEEALREFIAQVPLLSPLEISNELEKLGYKGQIDQRRALAASSQARFRRACG